MIELVGKLSQTPLPTILVVAGSLFLFVGLGGSFKANIITDKVNVRMATFSGLVLLLLGIIIYITPMLSNNINVTTTTQSKIVVGQSMKFTQGAMTCHNLESITKYFEYLESGSKHKINELLNSKLCGYSIVPRLDVVVLEVDKHFIKVEGTHNGHTSIVWIKDEELIK